MHTYGGMPAPLAGAAVVLFAAYLATFPTLASWFAWRVFGRRGPLTFAAAMAGSWTLAELARGSLFTGFPWLAIGYAQLDGPLAQLAPLLGVYGVGATATLLAALLAGLIPSAPHRPAQHPQPVPADTTAYNIRRSG
jgi:apolipoprotein N-acyltransferase